MRDPECRVALNVQGNLAFPRGYERKKIVKRGYVQVYTGEGKGKTTAALGLTLRAAGAGLKIFILQFIKNNDYSELKALKRFSDLVTVEQFGCGFILNRSPGPADFEAVRNGLERVKTVLASAQYDVVILDEANVLMKYALLSEQDCLDLIALKPESTELVFTGRHASPGLMEAADLVTEMRAVKHYFEKGVIARPGIEK